MQYILFNRNDKSRSQGFEFEFTSAQNIVHKTRFGNGDSLTIAAHLFEIDQCEDSWGPLTNKVLHTTNEEDGMKSRDVDASPRKREASHDILEINEQELCRIILDIHDGPVQNMYAALSQINTLQGKLTTQNRGGADGPEISHSLTRIAGLLESSLAEIKNFIGTFRPPEFQKRDLISMFKGLLIQHESLTGSRIEMEVTEPLPSVSVPTKIALYRILQEALSNAYRHAGTDRQDVRLYSENNGICMEVADQGTGFDFARVSENSATQATLHIGLRGMQNRVELLGGKFHLQSSPGSGTRVSVWVPCNERDE